MAMAKITARCERNSQKPTLSAQESPASKRGATRGAAKPSARASASDGGGRERLLDEHDRDVGDDRIDQAGGGAVEPLLDHRLLIAEVLAVLLDQRRPHLAGELNQLQLTLGLRADQDFQQLGIDGHDAGG